MRQKALVVANYHLNSINGKTAHGLIRKCERFDIVGVIDPEFAGKNLQDVVPRSKPLPIFSSITEATSELDETIDLCITGVATHGGKIPDELKAVFFEAINAGLSIVNGLHEFLSSHSDLKALAEKKGVDLIDIRQPKKDLRFWNGEIYQVECPIISVLGTDCALGKRTTTQWILDEFNKQGVNAQMVYTGQTGWLQGAKYGFIFDVTPNDFVSGELEGAILDCYKNEKPDLILIEGQSSLRNPSGPCGAEFLLSANTSGVVLQHAPAREFFEGYEDLKIKIPSAQEEISLINSYGSEVIAVSINTENIADSDIESAKKKILEETEKPTFSLIHEGPSQLVNEIQDWMKKRL